MTSEGEGKGYAALVGGTICFSPDGRHLAYVAWDGSKHFLVIDGSEGDGYEAIGEVAFEAPDRLRAVAFRQGKIIRIEATPR